MVYRISGLNPGDFAHLIGASDAILAKHRALRMVVDGQSVVPCRISLRNSEPGESVILLNHVSHDVATPYRSSFAIFVREAARTAAEYIDALPPSFEGRPLALRGFTADGMLHNAALALPGEGDSGIRTLFDDPDIAYIDVHNAAHGCFAARARRADHVDA